jgi:hypothetical protein
MGVRVTSSVSLRIQGAIGGGLPQTRAASSTNDVWSCGHCLGAVSAPPLSRPQDAQDDHAALIVKDEING